MALPPHNRYRKQKKNIVRLLKQERVHEAHETLRRLKSAHADDYDLHYLEGMIHASQQRYADAMASFSQALQLNPGHPESEFELGIIQMVLCRFNRAADHLQRVRNHNYRRPEIDNYLQQIEKVARAEDVTLSACLIVKNEEQHLPGCLKSLQAVADEIVVVDTGSQDATIAIAESFGAKVYPYRWQNDFAAARNFANQQANGDWIIQLDADEELFPQDQNKVREVIHQDKCNGAYLALHNRVSSAFGENKPSVHYLVRMFKNRPDFIYENPIHEVLKISGEVIAVDINLLHHGYNLETDYMLEKRRRNAEILYRRLQENPESVTTLFYLGMMHLGNRQFELAESFGKRALEKIKPNDLSKQHLLLMTLNNLALISHEKNDLTAAKTYCERAIALNENYLDPHYFLGLAYYKEGQLEKAKEVFKAYLEQNQALSERPVFNLFGSSADAYLYQVYHFLGKIYRKQRQDERAIDWMTKAVASNPNFWIGFVDLGYIHVDLKQWAKAADSFDQAIKLARNNPEVNEKNETFWYDFTNAVRTYARVLKKMREEGAKTREIATT
ncbi:MAG: tetratricopeptide repeat protein [bacterium]